MKNSKIYESDLWMHPRTNIYMSSIDNNLWPNNIRNLLFYDRICICLSIFLQKKKKKKNRKFHCKHMLNL